MTTEETARTSVYICIDTQIMTRLLCTPVVQTTRSERERLNVGVLLRILDKLSKITLLLQVRYMQRNAIKNLF